MMREKAVNILSMLLLAAGLGLVFYPRVSEYRSETGSRAVIREFEQTREAARAKPEAKADAKSDEEAESSTAVFEQLYRDLKEYNRAIYEQGQFGLRDPFLFETPAFDLAEYGIRDDVAGYVSIPKMEIELPVSFGATQAHMEVGAVILGDTSAPVGGASTNVVLAAHRGWWGSAMFRDIEELESGDWVYLTNFWETLEYQVVGTRVIDPGDIEAVSIQAGRDMMTLISCHPYSRNEQRYVVYCERAKLQTEPGAEGDSRQADGREADTGRGIQAVILWSELSKSQRMILAERWIPTGVTALLGLWMMVRAGIGIRRRRKQSRK